MRRVTSTSFLAAAMLLVADAAVGQNITVQQPAFGRFSVNTTVVVPDSGRGFLGSVSRAADGRKSFGPFVRGSSVGSDRQHAGLSSSVTIHDLREWDRRLLQQGRADVGGKRLTGYAGHAYRDLTNRNASRRLRDVASRGGAPRASAIGRRSSGPRETTSSRGDLYLRLARRANASGNRAKAAALYKIAARYGATPSRRGFTKPTQRIAGR